jgi:hypothetical protein
MPLDSAVPGSPEAASSSAEGVCAQAFRGRRLIVGVGPLCVAVEGPEFFRWRVDAAYAPFLFSDTRPDLRLAVEMGPAGSPPGPPIFQLDGLASIHRDGTSWVFRLGEEGDPSNAVDRVLTLNGSGNAGTLRMDTDRFPGLVKGYPLSYPLEDLLFRHLLADRNAVLVHACGISWEGRGFLFVGSSGAGKSTAARLWKAAGATILNDDRIVLEAAGDGTLIHPTPWSGEVPDVGGGPTPLAGLYFLRQGFPIVFEPVRPATVVSLVYAKSFPPVWDPEGITGTLRALDAVCRRVPCGWLTIPPDQRAVSWVQEQP